MKRPSSRCALRSFGSASSSAGFSPASASARRSLKDSIDSRKLAVRISVALYSVRVRKSS
jgi:hypothetical protein